MFTELISTFLKKPHKLQYQKHKSFDPNFTMENCMKLIAEAGETVPLDFNNLYFKNFFEIQTLETYKQSRYSLRILFSSSYIRQGKYRNWFFFFFSFIAEVPLFYCTIKSK